MLKINWSIEPGDGTGCSIQDAIVRNQKGICSILNCGNAIKENTISYGIMQKLCSYHEEWHKNWIESCWD